MTSQQVWTIWFSIREVTILIDFWMQNQPYIPKENSTCSQWNIMDFLDPARPILLQFCWRFGVCSCGEQVCSFPLWLSSSNSDIGKHCILDKLVNSLVPILWELSWKFGLFLSKTDLHVSPITWEFSAVWNLWILCFLFISFQKSGYLIITKDMCRDCSQ